ncbi:hypothetical protein GCM10027160_17190 [Streptomyces calidiresistens]|uniref:DUF2637 domain-containing protein n=1 Tax=Streptomyces calidiresistens TaxID=1485586 RepID=A0A7W3SZK2_9ACTN|nr:DUF2637 domain-containing protein [Streptomyces calidiresistens]MBB0228214.1 DUF2637 domain-containing protein [Streptomyces calidiresistens]
MSHTPPVSPARINGWDRAAIVALGGAGCALSYDALQQMATAIHVRGILTFLFPLVIDGFIAYGVRALLVLRTDPLPARCYVWLLFGTATSASIWANALHAVRLNQQQLAAGGLHLGDVTVGVLSTLAPLALAGAVHLYILIARRAATADTTAGQPDNPAVRVDRLDGARPDKPGSDDGRTVTVRPDRRDSGSVTPRPLTDHPSTPTHPGNRVEPPVDQAALEKRHGSRRGTDRAARPVTGARSAGRPHQRPVSDRLPTRPEGSATDTLLPVARRAVTDAGKVTRQVVADAVRGQGIPLSNDRLTDLMAQLRTEAKALSDSRSG